MKRQNIIIATLFSLAMTASLHADQIYHRLPGGSYKDSCKDCTFDSNGTFTCSCNTGRIDGNGQQIWNVTSINGSCSSLTNNNGNLACQDVPKTPVKKQ